MEKAFQQFIEFMEAGVFQVFLNLLDECHFQQEANFIKDMFFRIDFLQHTQNNLFLSILKCPNHSQFKCRLQIQEYFISLEFQLFIEDEHDEAREDHAFHKLNGTFNHPIYVLAQPHIQKQCHFAVILDIEHILLSTFRINLEKISRIHLIDCQKVAYTFFGKVVGKLKRVDKVAEL